jgi:hypothetical protein
VVLAAAAEERSLDGVGLEESAECRSRRGRDRNIREAADGSPWMGDGGGSGEGRDLYGHSRRRRRKWALEVRARGQRDIGSSLQPDLLLLRRSRIFSPH